jgi:hypothetical protein
MWDDLGWVAGLLALVLSAICLWLTVRYGEQARVLLQRICSGLGIESHGNR